ncbi:clusterin-like protein 1 [Antennarius striatus]|uniref:clusterin-like protein 1 n=1 Tax=Antennarius striatus TaxID=241820 RepID=UPI0035B4E0D4
MKLLFGWAVLVLTVGVICSDPEDQPMSNSEDMLKQLSMNGEKLVNEEVTRALYGVKQMKEMMLSNERKHENLMKSLKYSSNKKKGAAQLTQEVTEKLQEAEEQCRDSLHSEWEACRPCLEDACKSFYTSTCRRGFATFHAKVQNLFHKVSRRFGPQVPRVDPADILVNQDPVDAEDEFLRIENSFNRLRSKVGSLVDCSVALIFRMRTKLNKVLQRAFLNDTNIPTEEATTDPYSPSRDSGFLQGIGLEEALESFFDFGKSVVDEFGAVVTQMFDGVHEKVVAETKKARDAFPSFMQNRKLCRDLRKQPSECWKLQDQCEACQGALLTECPSVRELHEELDAVSQLVNDSKEQYEEILSIVQRHIEETTNWLFNMAAEFSWVAKTLNNSSNPENIFRVTMVAPKSPEDQNASVTETKVEVNILQSPPFILSVPGELDMQDPTFIQYVTHEALNKYKEMVRLVEE